MFSWYLVLKFLHILSAIVAVGSNITYGVWSIRAANDSAHLGFALKGIKFLDDRIANPAYGVLLLTGLLMWFFGNFGFALWLVIALVLFAADRGGWAGLLLAAAQEPDPPCRGGSELLARVHAVGGVEPQVRPGARDRGPGDSRDDGVQAEPVEQPHRQQDGCVDHAIAAGDDRGRVA